MEHKVTPRQLEALLAVYCGQGPYVTPDGLYGTAHELAGRPVWRHHTNMGGAIRLMVERLRADGFLSEIDRYERNARVPYADEHNALTVKGYEAIQERLGKLPKVKDWREEGQPPFDFNELVSEDIAERKNTRALREIEMEEQRRAAREELRARSRALAERNARDRLAKLRKLFTERGLADNWGDADLLDFADKVASI